MTHNIFYLDSPIQNYQLSRCETFNEPSAPIEEFIPIASAPSPEIMASASEKAFERFSPPVNGNSPFQISNILLTKDLSYLERSGQSILLENDVKKPLQSLVKEAKGKVIHLDPKANIIAQPKIQALIDTLAEKAVLTPLAGYHSPDMAWIHGCDQIKKITKALYESDLDVLKKAELDVCLRTRFVQKALSLYGEQMIMQNGAECKLHPNLLSFLFDMLEISTHSGCYAPVIDIKGELLKPFFTAYAEKLAERLIASPKDALSQMRALRKEFELNLNNHLENASLADRIYLHKYLVDAFSDHVLSAFEKIAADERRKNDSPVLFAQRIWQIHLLSNDTLKIQQMLLKHFQTEKSDKRSVLPKLLPLAKELISLSSHEGMKALVAGQVLDAIMELELPLYKEAAQQDKMVDSWPQDIEAIYNTLTEKVDISLLRTEGPITLPKEILLSSPLFEPMLTILKDQIQKSIFSEEAKKKAPLNLNEKSEIYQQVLERWIKSCEPLAEKDRKDLLSFMAAKLALFLSYDKTRLTPYQALEVFEKEGYLPGELYRDALTLQKLLTQAGTYPQAFHFVTNTLSTTFSHEMIEKRLESLAEQIKKASTPLLKAQKKTLQWVLKVMNSPHIECSPPSFFDELFFSMEIEQLRHEIQTALDEIYELRGKAMNGLIHKAWLDYMKAQADKIVCFDEIAPPWDKERISTPQIIMLKKALKNTDLIGKTAPTISEIVEKKDFGTLNLGAVTADEFFKHVDLKPYQLAQKKVKEAKEHFERLKMREKELIGEGISLSPIEDEQGQLIGYSAKEGTILHDLSDKLRTLICESL